MKAFVFTALIASMAASTAFAKTPAELAAEAKKSFETRDYSQAGVRAAATAADLYAQAAEGASDAGVKAGYLVLQSEALYFVGAASDDKTTKLAKHDAGMKVADQALKLLGLSDVSKASDADLAKFKADSAKLATIGEGLYQRGVNLGQWGAANGVVQSLSKWPELKRTMEMIDVLGLASLHDYGAYRTLGRGFFKIPSLLGGDIDKAEKYLATAFNKTKAAGSTVSKNGYNNLYYAEVLFEKGNQDKAKKILQDFIKADPSQLDPGNLVDLKEAQRQAKELLKSW